jgi:hypothetical protein
MSVAAGVLGLIGALTATASAQPGGSAAEQFVLSGVVAFDNGDGKAWLQEPRLTQGQVVVVRRGERVGPWRVTGIFANRVELEGPGGRVLVPLQGATASVPLQGEPRPSSAAAANPKTIDIPVGDPRRRESIAKFTNLLSSGAALGGGQPAARQLPDLSPRPAGPPAGSGTPITIPVGDPRRREAIKQLFGPR